MTAGGVLGAHGVAVDVADPEGAARLWRRALGLPVLRRNRNEVVLGSVAFFVVLRRARARAPRLPEIHVAVENLKGRGVRSDELGGRSEARDLEGIRLVVRELIAAPSSKWVRRRRSPAARKSRRA